MVDLIILIACLFALVGVTIIYINHVKSSPNPAVEKRNRQKIAAVIALMLMIMFVMIINYLERARSADMLIEHRWKGGDNA